MQTKATHFSPENATPCPIYLANTPTGAEGFGFIPAENEAAVQLANMRAWLAGVALITILNEVVRTEQLRAGVVLHADIEYRTGSGRVFTYSTPLTKHADQVDGVRREWWIVRQFIGSLLASKYPCGRCYGVGGFTQTWSYVSDIRIGSNTGGHCYRCWNKLTDPLILDYIAAGGDPSKTEVVVLRPIE